MPLGMKPLLLLSTTFTIHAMCRAKAMMMMTSSPLSSTTSTQPLAPTWRWENSLGSRSIVYHFRGSHRRRRGSLLLFFSTLYRYLILQIKREGEGEKKERLKDSFSSSFFLLYCVCSKPISTKRRLVSCLTLLLWVYSRHHSDNHVIPAPVLFAQFPPLPFTLVGRVNAWRWNQRRCQLVLICQTKRRMTSEHTDTTRLKDNTKRLKLI